MLSNLSLTVPTPANQIGSDVTLEQAKKVIVAGQAEASKDSWPVAIAVVDNRGFLVAFEKMHNTQTASVQVAIDKAVSSAMYRRPTKAFQDAVAGGGAGLRALNLRGASMVEGGLPIVVGGRIVGGVGVSGVTADQRVIAEDNYCFKLRFAETLPDVIPCGIESRSENKRFEGMHAERIVGHELHGGMPSYRSLGASTLNSPLARDETLSRSQHTNPIGVR